MLRDIDRHRKFVDAGADGALAVDLGQGIVVVARKHHSEIAGGVRHAPMHVRNRLDVGRSLFDPLVDFRFAALAAVAFAHGEKTLQVPILALPRRVVIQ
jgi:hypothetical protein